MTECQHLLQLFGVPYVFSPSEAEAQCAMLEQLGLVDGVVTDDSDIFLFGAQRVFRNMFAKDKYVERYDFADVKKELALDRNKLIQLAMLLGSDYTTGVQGVGPVAAVEILQAFPDADALKKFKEFILSKGDDDNAEEQDPATVKILKNIKRLRGKVKLPEDFPSETVAKGYTNPLVDVSREQFEWSRPDLNAIRDFAIKKFGWQRERIDKMLFPILKTFDDKEAYQSKIDVYFPSEALKVAAMSSQSTRLQTAIAKMSGKKSS